IFFPAIIFYGVLSIIFKKAFAPVKTVFQSLFGYRYMPGVSGITGSGKKANGKKERGEEKGVKEGDKP
ncbi:MAG: hypothetical protein FJ088_08375, partial [Deltaproteobacteria bacterium]|nr:hypothetical protein [Deltaproteobacteria bacterium]